MRFLLVFFLTLMGIGCTNGEDITDDPYIPDGLEEWTFSDTLGCRYGVRWQLGNPNDLGERCFDAKGLRATFGVGSGNGYSDFDRVYPWSQIRRCNVRFDSDSLVIVYDNEPGFALDGSNGDVMVRIPKFYVEKYIDDGYEYREMR